MEKLVGMNPRELREVHARVAFLLGAKESDNAPKVKDGDMETVLAAMNYALGLNLPLNAVLKSNAGVAFRKGAAVMIAFCRNELKAKGRVAEIKALRLLLKHILKDLAEAFNGPIPATPRVVAQRMERVAETVDRHFPLYRQAGLLPVILQGGRSSE